MDLEFIGKNRLWAQKLNSNFQRLNNILENNKTLKIGNFIGKDNYDLNNVSMGVHGFGF